MTADSIFFTHPLGVGIDPALPHFPSRGLRRRFAQHPASDALWDVWNDKTHQRPRLGSKRFGASKVAWKVTNYWRVLRVAGRAPQTIEAWWSALESYLTEMDWAYLRVQATQLHRRIPEEVRDRTGLTRDDCYGFVLLKIVDDTFTGLGREDAALPVLQHLYPDVTWAFAGNDLDAGSAFDLVGFTGTVLTHVASVKPASWRHFYTKSKMWENRHKEHQKHERFLANRPDVLGIEISGEVEKDDWQVVPVLGRPCRKCELS